MNPARKKKLTQMLWLLAAMGCIGALTLYALRQNISLFFTPTQIARNEAKVNQPIRIGGMVKEKSIKRQSGSLLVSFIITDFVHEVMVQYTGILPDLFREGQGIVANGQLNGQGQFIATEVLAKHDENYMPPEAAAAIQSAARQQGMNQ